jgi:hypothetical protein
MRGNHQNPLNLTVTKHVPDSPFPRAPPGRWGGMHPPAQRKAARSDEVAAPQRKDARSDEVAAPQQKATRSGWRRRDGKLRQDGRNQSSADITCLIRV